MRVRNYLQFPMRLLCLMSYLPVCKLDLTVKLAFSLTWEEPDRTFPKFSLLDRDLLEIAKSCIFKDKLSEGLPKILSLTIIDLLSLRLSLLPGPWFSPLGLVLLSLLDTAAMHK
jgi:hypothetical protein